jgi:hypothetical protein
LEPSSAAWHCSTRAIGVRRAAASAYDNQDLRESASEGPRQIDGVLQGRWLQEQPEVYRQDGRLHGRHRRHQRHAVDAPEIQGEQQKKTIADAYKTAEVLTCLCVDSKGKVDEVVDQAVAAGGSETKAEEENKYKGMYARHFDDLDGHIWEIMWMEPNGMK